MQSATLEGKEIRDGTQLIVVCSIQDTMPRSNGVGRAAIGFIEFVTREFTKSSNGSGQGQQDTDF